MQHKVLQGFYTFVKNNLNYQIDNVKNSIEFHEKIDGSYEFVDAGRGLTINNTLIAYADGTTDGSSHYKCSDFIEVKAGTKIVYKLQSSGDACSIAFYTTNSASGFVVAFKSAIGTEESYTVSQNGYIRLCCNNDAQYIDVCYAYGYVSNTEKDKAIIQEANNYTDEKLWGVDFSLYDYDMVFVNSISDYYYAGGITNTGTLVGSNNYYLAKHDVRKGGRSNHTNELLFYMEDDCVL